MPIYQYLCENCKSKQEVVQPITKLIPPKCCNTDMKRLISPSTFILQGGGWAKDGYSK